jgi:hypothetical protein
LPALGWHEHLTVKGYYVDSRNDFILNAFKDLKSRMSEHFPFDQTPLNEEEADLIEKMDQLFQDIENQAADYSFDAQEILSRFIRCYANLVPLVRRELLWFIGGECLHFLGDEELSFYQELEDRLYQLDNQGINVDLNEQIKSLRQELDTNNSNTTH